MTFLKMHYSTDNVTRFHCADFRTNCRQSVVHSQSHTHKHYYMAPGNALSYCTSHTAVFPEAMMAI